MNTRQTRPRGTATPQPAWPWPFDVSAYDRTPTLSAEERAAIASWAAKQRCRLVEADERLVRLLRPVRDVLDRAQVRRDHHGAAFKVVIHAIHTRGAAFWAWDEADWKDILQSGWEAYSDSHATSSAYEYRQYMIVIAYLLGGFTKVHELGRIAQRQFARRVFGQEAIDEAERQVEEAISRWGCKMVDGIRTGLCAALLENYSPRVADLTVESLERTRAGTWPSLVSSLRLLSRVFVAYGIIQQPHEPVSAAVRDRWTFEDEYSGEAAPQWVDYARRWFHTSTASLGFRKSMYYFLLHIGAWAARDHPEATSPQQWTREIALAFVPYVDRMVIGGDGRRAPVAPERLGKPIKPRTKERYLVAARTFFRDCQEWDWIPQRFDPRRCFATPRSIRRLIGSDPNVIEDEYWLKLLSAGLQLTSEDIPYLTPPDGQRPVMRVWYPLEMVRAIVMLWLFSGLRNDEIRQG